MQTAAPSPTSHEEREVVLDALRGVALFGVLTVNAITIFRVSLFEMFLSPPPVSAAPLDRSIGEIIAALVEFKAFILFAFMFGVGLAAQVERVKSRKAGSFATLAARRLTMLLVMGVIHLTLVWDGDILTLYALVGFVAAPLIARLSARVLLAFAVFCFVLQVSPLPFPTLFATPTDLREHVEAATHIYPYGSFAQVLHFRIESELRPIAVLLIWTIPRTLGLFFLGGATWKARLFREEKKAVPLRIAMTCLPVGAIAMWLVHAHGQLQQESHFLLRFHDAIDTFGSILLALGYGSTIVALFHRSDFAKRVLANTFAPIGRMALTSYLTQSVVLGLIFYGYGLGELGRLGEASVMLIVLTLFAAQIVIAKLWLARFRYGPVEWAWRSFTYFRWQPLRRVPS